MSLTKKDLKLILELINECRSDLKYIEESFKEGVSNINKSLADIKEVSEKIKQESGS